MTEGMMTYEYDRDAWVVEINGYQYTLFCGESFELIVDSIKSLPGWN